MIFFFKLYGHRLRNRVFHFLNTWKLLQLKSAVSSVLHRLREIEAQPETFSKIMECQNIEWSSTRRESSNILQYSNYIQDWPQKIMESETGLIFQASTPKSKMKPYMILKSTEAIAAQSAFPRRATVLFRRVSHYIRYNSCVWRRWWRWFRRWSSGPAKHAHVYRWLNLESNLVQPKEFRIVTAVIVWN